MKIQSFFADFRKWFYHLFFYKIIALILAVVVYFYVNNEFK